MNRDFLLWTPILVSPAVWFLMLLANFAIAPTACAGGGQPALYAVSLICLAITGGSALLAFSLWRRTRREALPAEGAPAERVRSMATAGLVLSLAFFLVIVAQSIPEFILVGCE